MKMRYVYCRLYADKWIKSRELETKIYGAFTTVEYAKGYSFVREGDLPGRCYIDMVVDLEEETVIYNYNFGSKWVGIDDAIICRFEDGEEREERLSDWWLTDKEVIGCVKEALE